MTQKSKTQRLDTLRPERCAHPVPENEFGFFAHHTKSNKPIPDEQLKALHTHVLGPVHREVTKRIREDIKAGRI